MAKSFRCVMEMLKWVEPKTTLERAAVVCALWTQATNSEELWGEYIEAEGLEELIDCNLQPMKERYREALNDMNVDRFVLISKVKVFQFTTETFLNEFTPPPNISEQFSAIAILSKKEIFVCGGENRKAFLYSMGKGSVAPLPSMFETRSYHSALYCHRKVYVFGGFGVHLTLKTAECLGLKEREWVRLPDMINERAAFNACYRDKKVYICGGETTTCEVFDIVSLQYASLTFCLPRRERTVSFFYNNQLVAIVMDKVHFLENTGWREETLDIKYIPWGSSGAVVYGHLVYIPMNACWRIMKIDMKTLKGVEFIEDE